MCYVSYICVAGSFPSFCDFSEFVTSYFVVYASFDGFHCSCSDGLKEYICKHSLAVQSQFHGLQLTRRLYQRKAGRPKKVGHALSMD